jgi:hypothetical protein
MSDNTITILDALEIARDNVARIPGSQGNSGAYIMRALSMLNQSIDALKARQAAPAPAPEAEPEPEPEEPAE